MSLERKNREFYFSVYTPRSEYSGEELYHFCDSEEVRNLSRGRSPCQRVNHVKSGVIYFSAFIYSCIRYYSYVESGPNRLLISY